MESKLQRMAREKLKALNTKTTEAKIKEKNKLNRISQERHKIKSNEPSQKENNSKKENKVRLRHTFKKEDVVEMKRQAVIREREKRKKEKQKVEENQQIKPKNIVMEVVKTPAENARSSILTLKRMSSGDISWYKEEAKKREMKRERLRRKQQVLSTKPKQHVENEISQYKSDAIRVEQGLQRKRSKTEAGSFNTIEQLEHAFSSLSNESGFLDIPNVKKLIGKSNFCADFEKVGHMKRISWMSLSDLIRKKEFTVKHPSQKTRDTLAKHLISLCDTAFHVLAKYSKVRPSDINAIHKGREIVEIVRDLNEELPALTSQNDSPVSWDNYLAWLHKSLRIEQTIATKTTCSKKAKKSNELFVVHESVENRKQQPTMNEELTVIDNKIAELQNRLKQTVIKESLEAESIGDESSEESEYIPADEKIEKLEKGANDELFTGRCWMLCEKRNNDWLWNDDDERPEWIRCRNVCVQVEVTQIQNPFRMYISANMLKSGHNCMKRIGIEELSRLSEYSAKFLEPTKKYTNQKDFHGLGGADETWSKAQIEAAIRAELAMRSWVQQGEIPKQNDLVHWLLLHSVIRVTGDLSLDPDCHIDLLLPGDMLGNNSGEAISKEIDVMTRQNFVLPENKDSTKTKLVLILDQQNHNWRSVFNWLEYKSTKRLINMLSTLCAPELPKTDIDHLIRRLTTKKGSEGVVEALYGLVDEEKFATLWERKTSKLRIADIFDLFRDAEGEKQFVSAIQDSLLIDLAEWQLAIWCHRFPRHREFIQHMFNLKNKEL